MTKASNVATTTSPPTAWHATSTRRRIRRRHLIGLMSVWGLLLVLGLAAGPVATAQAPRLGPREQAQFQEAMRLYQQARQLYNENQFRNAFPLAQRTVQLCVAALGEQHEDTAKARNLLGGILCDLHRFEESKQEFERAIAVGKHVYGPHHVQVMIPLRNLARTLQMMYAFDEAAKCYDEIFAILPHIEDPGAQHELRALHGASTVARFRNDCDVAEKHVRRAIAICDTTPGVDPEMKPEFYVELANVHKRRAEYDDAVASLQVAIELYRQRFGEQQPGLGYAYERLAEVLRHSGRYAESRTMAERAIKLYEQRLGPRNVQTLLAYVEYGKLLHTLGNYRDAASQFEHALAGFEAEMGADHGDTAEALALLGSTLYEFKEFQRSRELLNRAMKIQMRLYGENTQETAGTLLALSLLAECEGDLELSLKYQQQYLGKQKELVGEVHSNVAHSLENLAYVLDKLGRGGEAQARMTEALEMLQALRGDQHVDTARTRSSLAEMMAAAGDFGGAVPLTDQARRAMQQMTDTILPSLSEYEQLRFLSKVDMPGRDHALSLGFAQRADARLVAQSAEWLLNSKAVANETLSQRARLLREATDPQSAELVKQLLRVRQRLAAAAYQDHDGDEQQSERHQAELKRLEATEQDLSRQLGIERGQSESSWVELNSVRQVIPPESVLVDIARFLPTDFQAPAKNRFDQPPRYVAWVIPPVNRGQVRLVDLGEAAAIDTQIERVRQTIEAPHVIRDEGEIEAENLAIEALKVLAQQILQPLLDALPFDPQQVLLSPDANLWLVPWSALPLADGRYSVEQYEFSYLVSPRDLVNPSTERHSVSRSVIMANPDFDLAPREALAATQAVLRRDLPAPDQLAMRSVGNGGKLPRVARLPGTAAEAEAIRPQLAALAAGDPLVYTDKHALEGVFKAIVRPKMLVLSTHGFFLEDQQTGQKQSPDETGSGAFENPLLRCGLLLAGCNERAASTGGDDGVLTGLEIVGTDLRGTELVVLSACQTGLGQINNGEGVAGLRQAFLLAGAHAVVATLWQIPDRDTALLMNDFFTNLTDGQTKAGALRSAQLARIAARRDRNGAAHPFFWAAFTVTGQ